MKWNAQEKQSIEQANAARKQEKGTRFQEFKRGDYSTVKNADELFTLVSELSAVEIKRLREECPSFGQAYDRCNTVKTPEQLAQEKSEADANAAAQAEADRVAAEEAAQAAKQGALPTDGEILLEGVEKLGPNSYRLTVDPGDGSNPEIFYGASQNEIWAKLRKSKANATREIRRRANKIRITDELKAMSVETVEYPPLVQPLELTPEEIFKLTEQQKNPATVLAATRKLRQASLTKEECDRMNQSELDRRYREGFKTASDWVNSHPEFYNCRENLLAMQELMGALDWAMTPNNVSLAFKILTEQGVFVDRPGTEPQGIPAEASLPAPTGATAPASAAMPEPPVKRLRPVSSTSAMPSRRTDSINRESKKVALTAEEYNRTPAADVTARYKKDPLYKQAVDDLIAQGKI